ncbi:M48 family metallopeptidase [Patescibacteria group bacterium]|nr:M48 family metallopeptidase [Patescibacteria group bacterium]MBU1683785.1 M48 family metallopeptidase [Patescibacteria group bacterium]MBU1935590.1 M48 family metallopeptidase [Patescibacteria group bacterium]
MDHIDIENQQIPFAIRKSTRARRLKLQVDSENRQISLVVPRFAMKFEINSFIKKQTPWIIKQWEKIEKQNNLHPAPKYETGDRFYYFGEPVTLTVRPSEKKRPSIRIREDKMIVNLYHRISDGAGLCPGSAADSFGTKVRRGGLPQQRIIKKTIENFYKKKASEVVHDRLEFFNEYYQLKYNRVTLRNQKSRWGSCSVRKNLNFNWRLVMAPIEVIDYVVVHELCHLKVMNHSAKFWNLVAEKIPNYKVVRKWLRENQYLLKV